MRKLISTPASWNTLTNGCLTHPLRPAFCLFALILLTLLPGSFSHGEIIDRIVAIVNGEIITFSELEKFRKTFYPNRPRQDDWLRDELDLLDARWEALDTLIADKLMDQEAERQKINLTEKQLDEAIESLKKEQGLSQSDLETLLRTQDLTYEDYRQEIARRLKRTRLINRVVNSKIEIKAEDLQTYYDAHLNDYMADESIRMSRILLPLPPNPRPEETERVLSAAKDMLRRAEGGEDVSRLLGEYSEKIPGIREGDLGYFKRGEMVPDIEKKAFRLKVGEMGGPILTTQGVILIRITDRKGSIPFPLADIRERVEKDYYRSEVDRQYREWIERLEEKSVIEVKL